MKSFIDSLQDYEVQVDLMRDDLAIISKWNWDYEKALEVQKKSLDFVYHNRSKKIFICCNHPHVFTMGRGLQKGKAEELKSLVDFDMSMADGLSFPVHKINRGGGLTFHYPGQWIWYPIVNLNHPDFNLKSLTYWVLDTVKKVLESEFQISNLDYNRALLGLWRGPLKMASVGIGIEKFVTHHGLALNLVRDNVMFDELSKTNPCGISSSTYCCTSDWVDPDRHQEILNRFHKRFLDVVN